MAVPTRRQRASSAPAATPRRCVRRRARRGSPAKWRQMRSPGRRRRTARRRIAGRPAATRRSKHWSTTASPRDTSPSRSPGRNRRAAGRRRRARTPSTRPSARRPPASAASPFSHPIGSVIRHGRGARDDELLPPPERRRVAGGRIGDGLSRAAPLTSLVARLAPSRILLQLCGLRGALRQNFALRRRRPGRPPRRGRDVDHSSSGRGVHDRLRHHVHDTSSVGDHGRRRRRRAPAPWARPRRGPRRRDLLSPSSSS